MPRCHRILQLLTVGRLKRRVAGILNRWEIVQRCQITGSDRIRKIYEFILSLLQHKVERGMNSDFQ